MVSTLSEGVDIELSECIPVKEWKGTLRSELQKLEERVLITHAAYVHAADGSVYKQTMRQEFEIATNRRNSYISELQADTSFNNTPSKEWQDIMEKAPRQDDKVNKYLTRDKGDHQENTGSALESQVGGDHYNKQGVQPLEATFQNFGYDGLRASIYTKVGKYLTREKGTHRKDMKKAIHCLEMQVEFYDRHNALEEEKL